MPLHLPIGSSVSPEDLAACRALLRGGSRSFHAASLLLPARIREPASALYAFCRVSDDAIDQSGSSVALSSLHARLDRIYRGAPANDPVDRAFAIVVERHDIPRALPDALLEGFAWDLEARRYETIEDLQGYGARVAGCVGVMMTLLMGRRDPATLARASELGVAMQLTNIARDVGEDARAGRVYLPEGWLRAAGIDPGAFLAAPVFSEELGAVVERLLRHADGLYQRAAAGISGLPADCRPAIHAARLLYAEIGYEVKRRGFDSVSQRAVVSSSRKLAVLLRAGGASLTLQRHLPIPALAEAVFLVEACSPFLSPARQMPWHRVRDRAVWVIDLFERLERRERLERAGGLKA
jgi:15-cis-phytoene synthase